MIGMPSAFALGIFSGKFILYLCFTVGSLWETASYTKEPLHIHFVQRLFIFHSVLLCTVNAAHRPGIIRAVLGVVAQVGDPRAVAVACREMHAIRRCKHLL